MKVVAINFDNPMVNDELVADSLSVDSADQVANYLNKNRIGEQTCLFYKVESDDYELYVSEP